MSEHAEHTDRDRYGRVKAPWSKWERVWQERVEALPALAFEHLATMLEALPADPATLSDRAQRMLIWLSKVGDDDTVAGVAELIAIAAERGQTP